MKKIYFYYLLLTGLIFSSLSLRAQSISYGGATYSEPLGTTITSVSPTVVGTPSGYSISPNLTTNTGLTFDTSTGIISGIPTTVASATLYTVTATYGGLPNQTATVTFSVPSLTLAYTGSPYTFTTGTAISTLIPNAGGATPASYSSSVDITALTGLTFNTTTGQISGTPTISCNATSVVITATYSTYTATATINITSTGFYYAGSPYALSTAANGQAALSAAPLSNGLPGNAKYSISPALPAGLTITLNGANAGTISGTPTAVFSNAVYTVTATNSAGTTVLATNTVEFDYSTTASATIAYSSFPATIYAGSSISQAPTVTQTATTGPPNYAISTGTLPAGLSINTTTGVISGFPTAYVSSGTVSYPITVKYTYETANPKFAVTSFTINVGAPSISYSGSSFTYFEGTAISSLTPNTSSGGTPISYTIVPSIHTNTGLNFNNSTGVISGTPTKGSAATAYTITANYNTTTPTVTTATYSVTVAVDGVNYTGSPFNYTLGTPITTVTPTVTGPTPTYSISPNLGTNTGLTFNTSTGAISGTPTTQSAATNYTITANFPGGTATTVVNISVTATSNTWTGTTSSDWSVATNWSSGVVPTSLTAVTIPNTANAPTVTAASSCYSVTITGNSTLTLNAALTVSSGLTLNNANLTFAGTGTATFGGASTVSSAKTLTIGASNTITFNAALTFANGNGINNTVALNNAGTINLNSTTLTQGTSLSFNNTGTINVNATTVFLANAVTNYTTPVYGTNLLTGGDVYSLKNTGTITANNGSIINLHDLGTIYNTGTYIAGTSNSDCTLNLSGNGSAIINSGTFLVGSTSTLDITGGSYNYGSGTATPGVTNNSGGTFAFMSDVNGDATIDQITNGGVITGSFYVQRYIPAASSGGYRLVSSPVYGGTSVSPATNYANLTYLNTTTPSINGSTYLGAAIGGPGGALNGFTLANINPTAFIYDEAIIPPTTGGTFFNGKNVGLTALNTTTVSYNNTNLTPATGTTPIYAGTGFSFYYIGQSTGYATHGAVGATTISYKGSINQGDVKFYSWFAPTGNLSYTTGTNAVFIGYNLVGNPYASAIDLNQVANDNFTSGTVTFYELTDAQNFVTWTYNTGTGVGTSDGTSVQYISSGQAFYIKATGTGQSLTFKEDQKINTTVPAGFLAAPNGHKINLNLATNASALLNRSAVTAQFGGSNHTGLHLMLAKDSLTFKTCGIFFNNAWDDKLDVNDATDLDGILPKIYMSSFTSDGLRTSINAMANYTRGKNIKLYVSSTTDGPVKMTLMDLANIDTTNYNVYLVDHYKNDTLNIAKNRSYSFNITKADSNTFGANRFLLTIVPKISGQYKLLSFNGVKNASNVALAWKTSYEGVATSFGVQKYDAKSKSFKTIDSLQSNGNGTYNYVDQSPVKGVNNYRLVQTSIDGNITYSDALIINYGTSGILSVYPNPAVDVVTVNLTSITSSITDLYDITIYNSMGKPVMHKSASGDAVSQDVSSLKPGIYIVDVKSKYGNSIGNAKFLKN